jgi:5-carboxymethyl-2-hydroxymuconate isomerase
MPHLVLEYSANVPDAPDHHRLLRQLHEALVASAAFDLANVKSRVVRHEAFRVADGTPGRAFVHLTAAVLDGRESAVLRSAGEALLAALREGFPAGRGGAPLRLHRRAARDAAGALLQVGRVSGRGREADRTLDPAAPPGVTSGGRLGADGNRAR